MEIGIITMGSHPDCDNLPPAGTRARLILMNYVDVQKVYSDDDGRIVAVEMVAGKVGYEFLGFRSDVQKSDEVVRREKSKERFKHALSFVVYEVGQIQKNNIVNVVKGRFMAIIENLGQNENSVEFLGRECGLAIVDGQIRNAYENGGVFTISLATPDNGVEFERRLPQTLGTSYENALIIISEILSLSDVMTFDVDDNFGFDSTILYSFDQQ